MPAFKEENLPLDVRSDTYHDPVTGISHVIPLLDPKWIEHDEIEFISYVTVPINVDTLKQTCGNIEESELLAWEDRADFINNDLKWLLCQSHSRFWNHVIFNKSINFCLDSFLKSSPRSYDIWKFLPHKILNLQKEIHRNVFMVYLRMATHKESKKDFFTPETFGEILYENFLFDIPKIMDLCSLYGGENSKNNDLLTKMLDNVFKKQPKYIDDLCETIPSICQSFDQIKDGLGIYNRDNNAEKVEDHRHTELPLATLNDFILYLHDTTQTLISFLHILPPLCQYFFKSGFVQRIVGFYEEVMPVFDQRYRSLKNERTFLNRAKFALVKICRFIINAHCLIPLMDNEQEDHNEIKESSIEDFLSVIMELLSFKRFLRIYNLQYSFKLDIGIIHSSGLPVDETRLQYIISAIAEVEDIGPQVSSNKSKESKSATKYNNDKPRNENSAALRPRTGHSSEASSSKEAVEMSSESVSDVELTSMISHVKDLLPDCGEGFILLCLQKLNNDVEKTINLILENSLPGEISSLDRNLSKSDVVKQSSVLSSRHNIHDEDEFDIFSNTNVDLSRVHKGKSRNTASMKTVFDKERDVGNMKQLILNYDETFNDYEDEYDDTYDEQNVGAQDVDSADELSEITLRRPFTTPRALLHLKEDTDDDDEDKDVEEGSSKRGEPEETNEVSGERPPAGRQGNQRQHNAGKNDAGRRQVRSGNTERDRSYKDKNKAKIANHNRKTAAAKKYSKGMM